MSPKDFPSVLPGESFQATEKEVGTPGECSSIRVEEMELGICGGQDDRSV